VRPWVVALVGGGGREGVEEGRRSRREEGEGPSMALFFSNPSPNEEDCDMYEMSRTRR